MTVASLQALLKTKGLQGDDQLVVNEVENLAILREGKYVGYIELHGQSAVVMDT